MDIPLKGIKAVVFDVFGTLVEIRDKRRTYAQLLGFLERSGRTADRSDGARIMSTQADLAGSARALGVALTPDDLAKLEVDLAAELASIECFPDTIPAIESLKVAGLQVGLCSNLATPYGPPVQRLLPPMDAYAWSYVAGAVKPDPRIYGHVCEALCVSPREVLMIGDTLCADYVGPRAFGMHACHLARSGEGSAKLSISTLLDVPLLLS